MDSDSRQGKLVRDRIPQLIRARGAEPVTYVAEVDEYHSRLRDKLGEEFEEFLAADEESALEELADMLEVMHALAAHLGGDSAQLEKIRESKARERGCFADRVVWLGNR